MAELGAREGLAAEALQFTILTAARTNETLLAQWPEFDLEEAAWTVPGERMKSGAEHRVPLSKPTLVLLKARHKATGGKGFVFPGERPRKPLSDMSMLMLLERMGRDALTVHGFRSTFRDWVEEETSFTRNVAEKALAHAVRDDTERSYQRGDLFEKRRKLMDAWARFATTRPAQKSNNVVSIKGAQHAKT
jgi:integrase